VATDLPCRNLGVNRHLGVDLPRFRRERRREPRRGRA